MHGSLLAILSQADLQKYGSGTWVVAVSAIVQDEPVSAPYLSRLLRRPGLAPG
jgi:hypothetical protein